MKVKQTQKLKPELKEDRNAKLIELFLSFLQT